MEKGVPFYFIFSLWLALWTLLYNINFTNINPYLLNVGALLFTILFMYIKKNLDFRFIIINIFLHLILVLYVNKNITYKDIKYNMLVFCIYLYFLHLNNTNMYTIYLLIYKEFDIFVYDNFEYCKLINYIINKFK